jgi:hypothetical protein
MIFELLQKPFVQVLSFITLTILSIAIVGPKNTENTWLMAGYFFIGFMLVNSVLILFATNSWSYLFYSLLFSVLYLVGVSIVISTIGKILKIEGSGESAMIFLVAIYHPVLLLAMMFLKWSYLKLF